MPLTKQQRRIVRKGKKSLRPVHAEIAAADKPFQSDLTIGCEISILTASADTDDGADVENGTELSAAERLPTYSGAAYNGDEIFQSGREYPIIVNLATARIAKNPQQLLKDHSAEKPIGHHTPVITATEMRVENGLLSVPNVHRDEVTAGATNGFPWQASIRGRMGSLTLLKAGQSRLVNGRNVRGPKFIADNFLWRETTVTGLGANESGPQLTILASYPVEEDSMEFDKFVTACGLKLGDLSEDQKTVLMAAHAAKYPDSALEASATVDDDDADDSEIVASSGSIAAMELAASAVTARLEKKARAFSKQMEDSAAAYEARVAASQALELKAATQRANIAEVFGSGYDDLKAQAIAASWDKDMMTVQKKLRDYEKSPPKIELFASYAGDGTGPELDMVLAASIARSGGVSADELVASGMNQAVINEAESKKWRGMGYHGLIRVAMQAAGKPIPVHMTPSDYGRVAGEIQAQYEYLKNSGQLEASAGFTVMNLSSITDDAMNRSIHARYNAFASIIPQVANVGEARDFRPVYSYRVSAGGFLKSLADSGELTHLKISDARFSTEVDTKGAMMTVGHKYIVNDDLGIIKQMGDALGYKGAQTLERDFHIVLLTAAYWRTATGSAGEPINNLTGAGSVFGYAGMKASHNLWANMQDREGNPINVGPTTVLVQAGSMGLDARDLNKSEKKRTRNDQTTDQGDANVFQGMLNNVVETQWLNHSSMGALRSSMAWFQFAAPAVQPMFGVLFLNGQRIPRVETAPGNFNTLGQQMRVIYEYGIGQEDDIGGVKNDGA